MQLNKGKSVAMRRKGNTHFRVLLACMYCACRTAACPPEKSL